MQNESRAPALSRKESVPSMKNTKKTFSQSLRSMLQESLILYAASHNSGLMSADMMEMHRQTLGEETN